MQSTNLIAPCSAAWTECWMQSTNLTVQCSTWCHMKWMTTDIILLDVINESDCSMQYDKNGSSLHQPCKAQNVTCEYHSHSHRYISRNTGCMIEIYESLHSSVQEKVNCKEQDSQYLFFSVFLYLHNYVHKERWFLMPWSPCRVYQGDVHD